MTREILRERGRDRDGKRNTEREGVKEKQRDREYAFIPLNRIK